MQRTDSEAVSAHQGAFGVFKPSGLHAINLPGTPFDKWIALADLTSAPIVILDFLIPNNPPLVASLSIYPLLLANEISVSEEGESMGYSCSQNLVATPHPL